MKRDRGLGAYKGEIGHILLRAKWAGKRFYILNGTNQNAESNAVQEFFSDEMLPKS